MKYRFHSQTSKSNRDYISMLGLQLIRVSKRPIETVSPILIVISLCLFRLCENIGKIIIELHICRTSTLPRCIMLMTGRLFCHNPCFDYRMLYAHSYNHYWLDKKQPHSESSSSTLRTIPTICHAVIRPRSHVAIMGLFNGTSSA